MVRRPSAPTSASRAAVGNFSTPHDSVPLSLRDRSIVVGSRRSFGTEDFAYELDRGVEAMHSRIKLMIAAAGRTARQMEDIMARDDKARATLIRDAAGNVQPGKSPRAFA